MKAERLCHEIGHEFQTKGLLRQALTHRSYGLPNNERLEFLGDSVLNCCVASHLFERFPKLSEGELSRVRANLVNQQSLADVAERLCLGEYLLLGEGELKSGGSRRPSILADALEAIFGAIMLDAGFDAARKVIDLLYEPLFNLLDPTNLVKDPKTRLQEFLQGRRLALPQYQLVATSGEAHDQQFSVECMIVSLNIRATGVGPSRRAAEQQAAQQVYEIASKVALK